MILYKFNNATSSFFCLETETKQGSVLSAYLFTLYMDNLVKTLLNINVGCMVGSRLIITLLYEDNVVLIDPSVKAIKILLETCDCFHHVNFNKSKNSFIFQ